MCQEVRFYQRSSIARISVAKLTLAVNKPLVPPVVAAGVRCTRLPRLTPSREATAVANRAAREKNRRLPARG